MALHKAIVEAMSAAAVVPSSHIWHQKAFKSRFADSLLPLEPAREWVSTEQSLHFLSEALAQLLACAPDVVPSALQEGRAKH